MTVKPSFLALLEMTVSQRFLALLHTNLDLLYIMFIVLTLRQASSFP